MVIDLVGGLCELVQMELSHSLLLVDDLFAFFYLLSTVSVHSLQATNLRSRLIRSDQYMFALRSHHLFISLDLPRRSSTESRDRRRY